MTTDLEETKEKINKLVRKIKSNFVNGSLELGDALSEITLENENIDKFINNCIVAGIELQYKLQTTHKDTGCQNSEESEEVGA